MREKPVLEPVCRRLCLERSYSVFHRLLAFPFTGEPVRGILGGRLVPNEMCRYLLCDYNPAEVEEQVSRGLCAHDRRVRFGAIVLAGELAFTWKNERLLRELQAIARDRHDPLQSEAAGELSRRTLLKANAPDHPPGGAPRRLMTEPDAWPGGELRAAAGRERIHTAAAMERSEAPGWLGYVLGIAAVVGAVAVLAFVDLWFRKLGYGPWPMMALFSGSMAFLCLMPERRLLSDVAGLLAVLLPFAMIVATIEPAIRALFG